MKMKKLSLLMLTMVSGSTFAMNGAMSDKLLLLEAGGSYSYTFYKSHVVFPETVTPTTPGGIAINPKNFYPRNFWGGYIGLSVYTQEWLLNSRYDMFSSKSKTNSTVGTFVSLAPAKLSFTADKVWGCIKEFSFGFGGGVVINTINKGEASIIIPPDTIPTGVSIQGNTRIDPLIEGFAMYRLDNNVGFKLNVAYEIPVNDRVTSGAIGVNLGVNYSFPI